LKTRCLTISLLIATASAVLAKPIVVGSKKFTESYVLGEVAKGVLQRAGFEVRPRAGMGGTIILWQALSSGQIDLYPEYTGTIGEEILKTKQQQLTEDEMRRALRRFGVSMSPALGFNNTYALVMRRGEAAKLRVSAISDLRQHRELNVGLTHEFLDRQDGWRPLTARYGLTMPNVRGIDHAIGYAALASGAIDVKDAYSTDAKIQENDLVVLRDDLHFFPEYKAVFLYRLKLPPGALRVLNHFGQINEAKMIALNAAAERTKDYAFAASLFFDSPPNEPPSRHDFANKLAHWIGRHLQLAGISLLFSVMIGLPLGIAASRGGPLGQTILAAVGMIQTIPSLALLALLVPVPFLGISATTAIVALFLYGLLPIVRNTATGLQEIAPALRDSAIALGLEPVARLRKIYLPLASRTILAGIKTSAVINVGTATLAALIGAGGLGEPILSGLNLNDHATILQGAIPAALLALLVQGFFDLLDRVLIPRGLRAGS
jgi:osmoprotectant transport system permease protein